MHKLYNNKTILITGGTGSFGNAFVKFLLEKTTAKKIIILSRDEMKQWSMMQKFNNDSRLRFFIGDVRDKERLLRAFYEVDFVVHAAATKIVPTAEYDPFECIKTNVLGAMNVIDAAIDNNVQKVIALSTDKASSPVNLYGASKLSSDKLFIAANNYTGSKSTKFSVVRYGNVMGSRGSVIPFFLSLRGKEANFPITDERMTRFMITLDQGIEFVNLSFQEMLGGEIFVKKIPSMKVTDIAKAIDPEKKLDFIGIRPGEKIHEEMISRYESLNTFEYDSFYKILSMVQEEEIRDMTIRNGKLVKPDFSYESSSNNDWMSISDLTLWIEKNKSSFLEI